MRLHAERLAFNAGARGEEVPAIAAALAEAGQMDVATACRLLRPSAPSLSDPGSVDSLRHTVFRT